MNKQWRIPGRWFGLLAALVATSVLTLVVNQAVSDSRVLDDLQAMSDRLDSLEHNIFTIREDTSARVNEVEFKLVAAMQDITSESALETLVDEVTIDLASIEERFARFEEVANEDPVRTFEVAVLADQITGVQSRVGFQLDAMKTEIANTGDLLRLLMGSLWISVFFLITTQIVQSFRDRDRRGDAPTP